MGWGVYDGAAPLRGKKGKQLDYNPCYRGRMGTGLGITGEVGLGLNEMMLHSGFEENKATPGLKQSAWKAADGAVCLQSAADQCPAASEFHRLRVPATGSVTSPLNFLALFV